MGRRLDQLRNRLLLRYTNRRGSPVPLVFRRASWYFTVNNMFAKVRYSPREPFAGRIHVFTIKDRYADPTIGWTRWCAGGAVAHEIAGEFRLHRDLMRPPMVNRVAELLAPALDGTQVSHRAHVVLALPIETYREPDSPVTRVTTEHGASTSQRDRYAPDARRLNDTTAGETSRT